MAERLHNAFLRRLRSFIPIEFKKEVKELSFMALPVVSSMFEVVKYKFIMSSYYSIFY